MQITERKEMFVNIILVILAMIGSGILIFFISCAYKQHKGIKNPEYIELFSKEEMYIQNAYEGEQFNLISDQYTKYRESVLKMNLP